MKKSFLFVAILIISLVNFNPAATFAESQKNFWRGEVSVTENFAQDVLNLVNIERAKIGAKPLKLSGSLNQSANIRANELLKKFSHTRPDGSSCFTAIKISYTYVGENIAAGQPSAESVVEAWMNSQGHRENILNPKFRELGVGYVFYENSPYQHYWVQLFRG